jgi:hypothetical protein
MERLGTNQIKMSNIPDKNESTGRPTNRLHVQHLQLLLQRHAIWAKECRSNLSEITGQCVRRLDREESRSLHRRYGSKNGRGERAR